MATRDPGWNEALAQVGRNILEGAIQRRQMQFKEKVFEAEQSLAERKFDEERRINATNRIITMAPLLKAGTRVADNPLIHNDWMTVFPGSDPTDTTETGAGAMILNPETWENVVTPMLIENLRGMSREGQDLALSLGVTRELTGETGMSPQALALRENVVEWQRQSLEKVLRDPSVMNDIGMRVLGFTPTHIRLGGKDLVFRTETEANLAVEIWKHQDLMAYYRDQALLTSKQSQIDMAKELYTQMKDLGIIISRGTATDIISVVHEPWNPDDPQSSADHMAKINALRMKSLETAAAVDMYLRGATLASEAANTFLTQFPGFMNYLGLGASMEAAGIPKEIIGQTLPGIARQMQKQNAPIAAPRRYRLPGQQPFTGITTPVPPSGQFRGWGQPPTNPTVPAQPEAERVDAMNDIARFQRGEVTVQQLTAKWGAVKARAIIQMSQQPAAQ